MAEEASNGDKDALSLPHPCSTIHHPSTQEQVTCVEHLLGDEDELLGEQMFPYLASVHDQVLSTKAQVFATALESCQAQLVKCQQRLSALELSSPPSWTPPSVLNHLELVVRCRAPEPKDFSGSRDPRDIDNFMWDFEAYFEVAKIPPQKQTITCITFLFGEAKL